eukprot:scaffold11.g3846.t1
MEGATGQDVFDAMLADLECEEPLGSGQQGADEQAEGDDLLLELAAGLGDSDSEAGGTPAAMATSQAQRLPAPSLDAAHRIAAFAAPAAGSGVSAAQRGGLGTGVFKDVGQGSLVERLGGLRIKNPVVSNTQLHGRLEAAQVVRLGQVRSRQRSAGLDGVWATIAVVGEKSKPRESAADLDQACLSLFLFGHAHAELWREPVGTLVAVFAPKVKSDSEFSLSVDSAEQAREHKECRERGALPHAGQRLQAEYNRLKPVRRNEFQDTNLKTAFRHGFQRGMKWRPGQFEPSAGRPPATRALAPARLESAARSAADRGSSTGSRYVRTVANPAAALALQQQQSVAALKRERGTGGAPIPLGRATGTVAVAAAAAAQAGRKRKAPSHGLLERRPVPPARPAPGQPAAAGAAAVRGPQRAAAAAAADGGGGMVELEEDDGMFGEADEARRRAVELVRAAGGLRAPDPNFTARPSAIAAAEAAARARGPHGGSGSGGAAPAAAAPGRQQQRQQQRASQNAPPPNGPVAGGAGAGAAVRKPAAAAGSRPAGGAGKSALEQAFGSVIAAEQAAAARGGAKARGTMYKELVDDEDHEHIAKVLGALERKDEAAAKMESIRKLAVQAFRCQQCGYTAERRRPECAAHPHAVERVQVTKRWWECDGCKGHFSTLGVKYPSSRCPKCNIPETGFTPVSMFHAPKSTLLPGQQSAVASRDQLLPRGVEQKWVNM